MKVIRVNAANVHYCQLYIGGNGYPDIIQPLKWDDKPGRL